MAETLANGLDPRKKLYSALVSSSDKEIANQVKKFSYNKFNSLLDDNDFVNDLFLDISERGIVLDPKNPRASKDPVEFANAFVYKEPPAPKPQAAPKQQAVAPPVMEEEDAYIPEPPPAIGSREYDAQLQAQYGGMAPTLGATFGGVPASFETKEQKKQEQISPVFKAQQLAFEDVPIASEQRKAQREFAKAEKQQQQAAIRGGTGFEVEQAKKAKERGLGEWGGDLIGSWAEGGKRIAKNILSTAGYFAQTQAATDPMASLPYEKRQEMMGEASQTMYNNATAAQNSFQDEIAKRNIQTSVLQAIDKGDYSKIPEAVLYTVGDAAMQIIPSILTFGGSTYMQTLPQVYKDGIDAIAKEKGMSPEQVIANGDDAFLVSQLNAGTQSLLEFAGAGLVAKSIASRGGYKVMRDWLLKQGTNRNLARGAALLGVGTGEAVTEYLQEGTGQIGTTAAKSETTKAFLDKLPKELFTPEARKQRKEAFVGGLVGGLGLTGGGQAIQSAMDRTLFEAPKIGKATQRPDYEVAQTDDKIQQRSNMLKAMESAIQANPEAEGQIRERYRKLTDALELTDEEVLRAYDGTAQLPPSPERDRIIQGLEEYMAEKGIQPEAAGMEAGLGEGLRVTSPEAEVTPEPPVIQTVNPKFPAPQFAPVEEAPAEELPPTEETPSTGMFEGITGPPQEAPVAAEEVPVAAEEELVAAVPSAPAPKGKGVSVEFPTELSVSEVKPYAEVPDNYYRPDQQLKFNQGNYYEPVRVIAHPDVIRAITIGSRLRDAQKRKTVPDSDIEFANKIAKQLGYTNDAGNGNAIMLHTAVKDLAKENRSKDEEVFMVIGNEAKAPKPAPVTPPAAPKAEPISGKSAKDMSLDELKAESSLFDEKIKAEKERLNKIAPNRQVLGGADIDNLSPEDAARYTELNDEIGRRERVSQEEAKKRVAEKREQRRKEQEAPKRKQIDRKSVESALGDAKEEYRKSKEAFDKKRTELDKSTKEDVTDIFGARKAQEKSGGLFEMPRISPKQREKAIQPFRDRMNKAKEEVNRLTKMLEVGEESGKEIEFKKEKDETKQLPRGRAEVREEEGGRVPEKGVPPSKPKKAKAVRKPGLIAQAKSVETQNPEILAMQGLISLGRLHPNVIEKIFGGGRNKNIQGERKARIGYLDKKSPHISTDGIAEKVAVFMAEALNMDVADVNERYNVRDYVEEAIKNHNSYASMAKEVIELDSQDRNAGMDEDAAYGEYLRQQEEQAAILGAEYNQDVADEVWDAAFNQMTEDDWNALDQMRIMDYLAQEEAEKNPLIDEINSLPLTRIEGLGMGQSQVSGVYISTEAENRYQAQRPDLPVTKVEVGIKNPYDAGDDFGLMEYRNKVLNDNKGEFTEFEYAEYEIPDGKVTVDDLNDEGIEKLAKLTQERLKSEGYDSVYFRETKDQEGELVVFDKNNVKVVSETKPTPKAPETKGAEEAPKKTTEFSKAISASSRFRPREVVFFDTPIVGPNGNELISYQWAYEWTMKENKEGELVDKRISDWTQAESSAETGRDVVHKFTVRKPNGEIVTASSESIPTLLGYVKGEPMKGLPSVVSAVKTLAKQRMQLAILEAQEKEYNTLKEKYEKAEKPEIVEAENRFARDGSFSTYAMGDARVNQDNKYNPETKSYEKAPLEKKNIESLERKWVENRVEEDGGKYPRDINELKQRIKRQERKVEEATKSKISIKEEVPTAKPTATTTATQAEFTSKQESSASEEFDGTKKPSKIKMKSFDGKHGKGAFERMQNITQNFEDIMDGLSEKIKQDCL